MRLGEDGLWRECWRRGSAEESRVSYWCWPSWFHRTFTLVLGTLGATMAGGGGIYGTLGQEKVDTTMSWCEDIRGFSLPQTILSSDSA